MSLSQKTAFRSEVSPRYKLDSRDFLKTDTPITEENEFLKKKISVVSGLRETEL
jgi:hypothetical protein